jgi:hypothetical protein
MFTSTSTKSGQTAERARGVTAALVAIAKHGIRAEIARIGNCQRLEIELLIYAQDIRMTATVPEKDTLAITGFSRPSVVI